MYSPNPVAAPGALAVNEVVTIQVTLETGSTPAPGAAVFLSFTHTGIPVGLSGGTAAAGNGTQTALTTTPTSYTADSSGIVRITYTAPAVLPTVGHDTITGQDLATSPTITRTDTYNFSPLASYVWSVGPPIAATGSLAASHSVTFTVTAENSAGGGIPGAAINLSLTTTAASGGSAIGTDTGGPSPITSTPSRFLADNNGAVSIAYTAPSTLPNGGVDTLTAQDHPTPTITATTTYTFAAISSPPPPPPTFAPHNVGAPQVAVTPDGSQQIVFWKDTTTNQLAEAWYALGSWHGPVGFPQLGTLTSTPGVAVTKDGSQQLVFWEGPGGHLFEAWYALAAWHGPVDITNGSLGGQGILASAPAVVTTTDGSELVFWRGTDGHLGEAWYAVGAWHGPADFTSLGTLASSPSATITADGSQQLVFFQGTNNLLTEDWYTLGSWHGPMQFGAISSPPSVTVTPDGSTQLVFSRTAAGHLQESWYTLGSWHGPIDWTNAAFGGNGLLTSSPSATVTVDGSTQIVFWQGAGSTLWEGWYTLGAWHGPANWSG